MLNCNEGFRCIVIYYEITEPAKELASIHVNQMLMVKMMAGDDGSSAAGATRDEWCAEWWWRDDKWTGIWGHLIDDRLELE